jgi:hypothetical protein
MISKQDFKTLILILVILATFYILSAQKVSQLRADINAASAVRCSVKDINYRRVNDSIEVSIARIKELEENAIAAHASKEAARLARWQARLKGDLLTLTDCTQPLIP